MLTSESSSYVGFNLLSAVVLNMHCTAHYSKSQILSKNSILIKSTTFSRVFHPKIFFTIFLVKSKLSTAKKSKTTTFSRVIHPKKIDNILGKLQLNFWTKNEDFEQYAKTDTQTLHSQKAQSYLFPQFFNFFMKSFFSL